MDTKNIRYMKQFDRVPTWSLQGEAAAFILRLFRVVVSVCILTSLCNIYLNKCVMFSNYVKVMSK